MEEVVKREAKRPDQSRKKPGQSRKKPGQSRKKPGQSRKKPGQSRKKPGQSRRKPGQSRKKPGQSRKKPGQSRKKPGQSRKKPGQSRKKPGQSRKKPGQSRKKPAQSRKKPAQSRKKPAQSRKIPEQRWGKTFTQQRAANATCVINILTQLTSYVGPMTNFLKQKKNILKQNKTADSKGGKKGAFNGALERLVDAAGGDKEAPQCQGSTTSKGALQMKNLTDVLTNCSDTITTACDPSGRPKLNMTLYDKCSSLATTFKTSFDACRKMTDGDAACTCFSDAALVSAATEMKGCNLAAEAKAMAKANKGCRQAYGNCRKYQEDIITVQSACSKSTDKLKAKAKTLTENVDNIGKAKTAVAALAARRFQSNRQVVSRHQRAVPTTCAEMVTLANAVIKLVKRNVASPDVSVKCKEIVAATGITCSADDKAKLKKSEKGLEKAESKAQEAKAAVMENLASQTGTTPSAAALEAFVPVTTAAPASMRRNMQDLLLRKFL